MEENAKRKSKIAVIEDDAILTKSLSGALEDAGFTVITALDGEAGLKLILEEGPDLVLLDIIMPKMDGIALMTALRESGPYGVQVPIILLTNMNPDDKIIGGVVKNAPAHYLVKSDYLLADVVTKVKECLPTENALPVNP